MSACVCNRPALRNLLERQNGSEFQSLVRPRDGAAREAQATFLGVAESANDARDWVAVRSMLDPVCKSLRLFDGQKAHLSLVFPATHQLQTTMMGMETKLRVSGTAASATPAVFEHINAAVRKPAMGPSDRSVRVLLLGDVHYLAAVLDPKVFDAQTLDVADTSDH